MKLPEGYAESVEEPELSEEVIDRGGLWTMVLAALYNKGVILIYRVTPNYYYWVPVHGGDRQACVPGQCAIWNRQIYYRLPRELMDPELRFLRFAEDKAKHRVHIVIDEDEDFFYVLPHMNQPYPMILRNGHYVKVIMKEEAKLTPMKGPKPVEPW